MRVVIYCRACKQTGKQYVGQAQCLDHWSPERAMNERMRSGHMGCWAILGAIDKYGKESFTSEILEVVAEQ